MRKLTGFLLSTLAFAAVLFTLHISSSNTSLKFLNRVEVFEPLPVETKSHRWVNSFNTWQQERANRQTRGGNSEPEVAVEAEPLEAAEPLEVAEVEPQTPRRGNRATNNRGTNTRNVGRNNQRNPEAENPSGYLWGQQEAEPVEAEPVEAEPVEAEVAAPRGGNRGVRPAAEAAEPVEVVEAEPVEAEAGLEQDYEATNFGWGVEHVPAKSPITQRQRTTTQSTRNSRGVNAQVRGTRSDRRADPFSLFNPYWEKASLKKGTGKTGFQQVYGSNLYQQPGVPQYFGGNYEQEYGNYGDFEGLPVVSESILCQMRCQNFDTLLREHTPEFCQSPLYQQTVQCINDQNTRTQQMTQNCVATCPRSV